MVERMVEEFGRIDILVTSAGIARRALGEEIDIGAANKYYVALDYLYSLRDFEDLLARYTTGDGTKVKRDNPPLVSTTASARSQTPS